MKKETLNKIKRTLSNFAIIFTIVFALLIIVLTSISQFVYGDLRFVRELVVVLVSSFIISVFITLILKINRISLALQVVLIYSILALFIVLVGYLLYIYDFYYNTKLMIFTIGFLLLGLIIITLVFESLRKKANKYLNDNLKQYKERDNYEKNN